MAKKVLVVAAHPDDEVLGCGGTIARHGATGDEVSVVFMADGVCSRNGADDEDIQERKKAMNAACSMLGIQNSYTFGFPDNRMDSVSFLDIVQKLECLLEEISPQVIYTHHSGDLNIDHRITHQAVLTACRPVPGQTVREIYSFEVLSSTEWALNTFVPNVFIDISDHLEMKIEAVQAYGMEMRPEPHTRSVANVRRQAELRGASVGMWVAEGFCLVKKLVHR